MPVRSGLSLSLRLRGVRSHLLVEGTRWTLAVAMPGRSCLPAASHAGAKPRRGKWRAGAQSRRHLEGCGRHGWQLGVLLQPLGGVRPLLRIPSSALLAMAPVRLGPRLAGSSGPDSQFQNPESFNGQCSPRPFGQSDPPLCEAISSLYSKYLHVGFVRGDRSPHCGSHAICGLGTALSFRNPKLEK